MPEKTLFVTESAEDRETIAAYLRTVADKLDSGEPITLRAGAEDVTLEVPARPTFEVKAERETGSSGAELSVEFELEWDENGDGEPTDGGSLSIE